MLDGDSSDEGETLDELRAAELRKRRAASGGLAAPSPKRQRTLEELQEQARTALREGSVVQYDGARKDQSMALESKKTLNKNKAQTAKLDKTQLEKDLKALQREVLRKKKAIAAKKNDERKYKQEAAILKNEEKCLEGRKINKEPLNGIYEDLVGPYQLTRKIEKVFNMRKPNSPIYVGTAAGPGKAHAVSRKRETMTKSGGSTGVS